MDEKRKNADRQKLQKEQIRKETIKKKGEKLKNKKVETCRKGKNRIMEMLKRKQKRKK